MVDESIEREDDESSIDSFATIMEFCGNGTVVLLQAYFDESERSNGLLCVAGYAFSPREALNLTKDFRAVFGGYGGFHMKDLVAKRKGFRDISSDDQIRLVKEAVAIVSKRFSYGVAVGINIEEFRAAAPRYIRGFGDAYPFLCHLAMTAMVKLAKKHNDFSPITYFYEAGHACEAEAREFVNQVSRSPELKQLYNYNGDAFLPKAQAIPLQAADLLAWEIGKFKGETVDKPIREMRRSLMRLLAQDINRYHVSFLSGHRLTNAMATISEFWNQQMEEQTEWQQSQRVIRKNSTPSTMQ